MTLFSNEGAHVLGGGGHLSLRVLQYGAARRYSVDQLDAPAAACAGSTYTKPACSGIGRAVNETFKQAMQSLLVTVVQSRWQLQDNSGEPISDMNNGLSSSR